MTPLPGCAALPELLPIRGARRERARRHAQEEDCRRGGVDDEVLEAWEKDVVRENERVLVVRERAWKGKRRGSNVLAAEEIWKGASDVIGRGNARGRCFARSVRFRTADSTQCVINLFT